MSGEIRVTHQRRGRLVRGHIRSLKTVIDAQAANDPAVYNIRTADARPCCEE